MSESEETSAAPPDPASIAGGAQKTIVIDGQEHDTGKPPAPRKSWEEWAGAKAKAQPQAPAGVHPDLHGPSRAFAALVKGTSQQHRWPVGQEMTEAEFDEAFDLTANGRIG